MGHLRALMALLAAGLLCAALAASASALEGGEPHEFIGNVTSEVSVVSSEQELNFAQVGIKCKGVKPVRTHKKTVFPALKILVVFNFIKCKTGVTTLNNKTIAPSKARFGGPLEIEYSANGEPDATIVNSKEDPFTITFSGAMEGCTIAFLPNRPTDEALYSDAEVPAKNRKFFPTGIQEVVAIDNSFHKIAYTIGGGACVELKKTEGKEGEFFGTLLAGLKTGDLSFE